MIINYAKLKQASRQRPNAVTPPDRCATCHEVPAVIAPNLRHSQKPDAIHDRIEALLDGPYLELFARRERPGWTCLGNELDGLDIRESLLRVANDAPLPSVRRPDAQLSLLEVAS